MYTCFSGNNEEIVVLLSPGNHNSFSLGRDDSGVANGRTIYRGAGLDTIVSGGVVRNDLRLTGFVMVIVTTTDPSHPCDGGMFRM